MAGNDDVDSFCWKRKSKKKDLNSSTDFQQEIGLEISKNTGPLISRPAKDTHFQSNKKTGRALVFCHTKIKGQPVRVGSDKDKKAIQKALEGFGFDVTVFEDLTFEDVTNKLEKASKANHSDNDCFAVVLMSHGLQGKVYASDMVYPVDRLWQPFLGENCPSLINKPKLFFIQACRGTELEKPVSYSNYALMSGIQNEEKIRYVVPNSADLLIMYSTMEKHYSWRNPLNGSWFIQGLADVMNEYSRKRADAELYELLTAVNRKVAYEYQSNVPGNKEMDEMKEMPNFVSTLTKIFVLRVKKE